MSPIDWTILSANAVTDTSSRLTTTAAAVPAWTVFIKRHTKLSS